MMGLKARHGAHHSAQNWTRTGWSACRTSVWNESSVTSRTVVIVFLSLRLKWFTCTGYIHVVERGAPLSPWHIRRFRHGQLRRQEQSGTGVRRFATGGVRGWLLREALAR